MDDAFVALLVLDLRDLGLADDVDASRWQAIMKAASLYTEHWILAYEAAHRGWLTELETGYVDGDAFFGALASNDVTFYAPPADSGVEYISIAGYPG